MTERVYIIDLGHYREKTYKGSLGRKVAEADRVPKVVALCADKDTADSFAEVYSFTRHGNAIYGLFGILIGTAIEIEEYARHYGLTEKIFAATASFR